MEAASPKVNKRAGPSVVWIIPLVTLLVGGWLIVKTLSEQGPLVTISFKTAEGIEVGKTRIKYKNVDIGVVEQIRFSDDFSEVIITAQFENGTEHFLKRNSRFWVVKPQLSLRGASGLGTLISGAYIEIEPGPGAKQRHFVGLEKQPVVTAEEQGKKIVLITQRLNSIDTGSPVYYQGLEAGEVLGYELANDSSNIFIYAFIKAPFHELIRGNTKFWNASGVDVSFGAEGFQVHTESLRSIMYGGIAFETPATLESASTDIDDLVFTLHESYASISEIEYSRKIKFMIFFNSSVRGLSKNAPVEFKGIKVGKVLDVHLEFDPDNTSFRIPVLIEIEPQRIVARGDEMIETTEETLDKLVEKGLRARLQTASLITQALYVELGMHPGTPVQLSGENIPYPELPALESGGFEAITQSAESLLAKLNTIDVKSITDALLETIRSADTTLDNTNALITTPGLAMAVQDMHSAMQSLKNVLRSVEDSNVDQVVSSSQLVLDNLNTTLDNTARLLEPDSPMQYNLIKMTGELEEMARSVRTLVETLERHPQALIFGKEQTEGQ